MFWNHQILYHGNAETFGITQNEVFDMRSFNIEALESIFRITKSVKNILRNDKGFDSNVQCLGLYPIKMEQQASGK